MPQQVQESLATFRGKARQDHTRSLGDLGFGENLVGLCLQRDIPIKVLVHERHKVKYRHGISVHDIQS